jgi:hypothetical protein
MRTIKAFFLLALVCLCSNTAQPAQTAQADLLNSSLRLNTGACDCDIGGLVWYMDFSSVYAEERPGANREVAPSSQPGTYSHWSCMVLEDASMWTSTSFMELNLPTEDINGNGAPDFLEPGIPASTASFGRYQTDGGPFPLTISWSRPAGASMGSYQLTMNDPIFGNIGPFKGSFEVIQSRGSLQYAPGTTEVGGHLTFPASSASPQLQGPVKFTKSAGDPLNKLTIQAGALTNEFDNFTFEPTALTRHGSVYSGAFNLPTAYYRSWTLIITDPNDADRDGIPDLSDDASLPPPNPPVLSLKSTAAGLQLVILGDPGRTCSLEETSSLGQPSWGVVRTFSLTADPHVLNLPCDGAIPKFWRVRVE